MDPSKIIERERTPLPLMAYAVYLYYASRSLRLASRCLEPLVRRSHVAIWKWVQKLAPLSDRSSIERRRVRCIFVDETLIHIKGREYWLWIAYEPRLDRCLMMHPLGRANNHDLLPVPQASQEQVWAQAPILTDRAAWYCEACRWLRLPHSNYPVEEKNLIERFIQKVKDRTECFDDSFPCRKEGDAIAITYGIGSTCSSFTPILT